MFILVGRNETILSNNIEKIEPCIYYGEVSQRNGWHLKIIEMNDSDIWMRYL